MTMQVIAAVAEFERDLLIERTQQGLIRAKRSGKHCGRPSSLSPEQIKTVQEQLQAGVTVSALARQYDVSRTTIQRVQKRA